MIGGKLGAGQYNRRVTIQSPPTGTDAQGNVDYTAAWTTYAMRWAKVEPLQGREIEGGNAQQADVDTRFVVRWDSATKSITPRMRVSYGGDVYNIVSVADRDAGHVEVEILAKREAS